MGQGIHTGLATIVAEELDADFDSVRVVNAANGRGPNGDVYGNPDLGSAFQLTGASNSMKGFWVRYRLAAAQARARLVAAAAEAWEVPADEVEVENGVLRHASGRQATFAELAARAEQLPVPDDVEPKDPADYKLIGREGRLRVDAVPKILGTTQFTIDLSLPGMLTAVVLHPPRFGATVASVDDQAALAEAGRDRGRPDRRGRRRRRRDRRRRAAWTARAGRGVGRHERRAAEHRRAARRAPPAARVGREGRDGPGRRRRRPGAGRRGLDGRRDVHVAVPRSRPDGAEQRGVPDARGRRARGLGGNRGARVREDERLLDRRDRQGAGRGAHHVRRRIVRTAFERRARSHGRGRADRASARLEAPDQGPVAPRGGVQGRSLPRDGRSPRAGRGRRGRSPDGVASADRGRADVREPAVRP